MQFYTLNLDPYTLNLVGQSQSVVRSKRQVIVLTVRAYSSRMERDHMTPCGRGTSPILPPHTERGDVNELFTNDAQNAVQQVFPNDADPIRKILPTADKPTNYNDVNHFSFGEFATDFNPGAYNRQNFKTLYEADVVLGAYTIMVLQKVMAQQSFRPFKRALDIATGGGLRTAALYGPLIADAEEGGTLTFADVGERQLRETERHRVAAAAGNITFWEKHQKEMSKVDPRWHNTFRKIASIGHVARIGFEDLPPKSQQIIGTGHGPESATDDIPTYEGYIRKLYNALEEGGLLIMPYTVGSNGYVVGSKAHGEEPIVFPAVAVYPEDVPGGVPEGAINLHELVRRIGFTLLGAKAIQHDGDNETIRGPEDPTHHWGLGVMILQKPKFKPGVTLRTVKRTLAAASVSTNNFAATSGYYLDRI